MNRVCIDRSDDENFIVALRDLQEKGIIDWHPTDRGVAKSESVTYGEFARMYHIARPDFSDVINYLKDVAAKIRSIFYRK